MLISRLYDYLYYKPVQKTDVKEILTEESVKINTTDETKQKIEFILKTKYKDVLATKNTDFIANVLKSDYNDLDKDYIKDVINQMI